MGTLANAIGVLGVLSTTLEAVPVVGSNLKVAAELASKICETVQVRPSLRAALVLLLNERALGAEHQRKSQELRGPRTPRRAAARGYLGRLAEGPAGATRRHDCERWATHEVRSCSYSRAFDLIFRLPRVLEEIQVTVHDRTRSNTPSPVGACGPLSTWLCNTSIDVTRMTADEDNVKEMRRKLDEVVVEFDVRRPQFFTVEPALIDRPSLQGGRAHAN
jgi:hypothetical protein